MRRHATRGSFTLVFGLLLAGCLGAGVDPAATEPDASHDAALAWVERALLNAEDHDHLDPAQHVGLSTPNFEVVGWDPLVTDHMGSQAGGYFCGDVETKDGRALAVVHSFTSDVAFVLIDVTDPAKPTKIGELVMEHTHVWDVAMTPDQRHVLLATSPYGDLDKALGANLPARGGGVWFRDACTGTTRALAGPEAAAPYHSGVALVDITDPRAPAVTDFRPLPVAGGHSIVAQDVGGETIALVTANHPGAPNYYGFLEILDSPIGAKLDTRSVYHTDPVASAGDGLSSTWGNHDGYLQVHPVTGERLAYLADGNLGVAILDIEDTRMPRFVSRWDDAASIANTDFEHFAHSVLPIDTTWEGRHYTFVSEECAGRPTDTPSCLVYVLDTTDPAAPTLAGAWTIPVDLGGWAYPGFSPHYMAVIDRTLFVAHWHAGLWAFDVSSADAIADLAPVGVFVPDRDTGYEPDGGFTDQYNQRPVVADVLAHGENVIAFDGTSGVYVLRFDATRPMPAPTPWPLRLDGIGVRT